MTLCMRAARADKATIEVDVVTDDTDYRAVWRAVEHRIEAVSSIARASGLAVKCKNVAHTVCGHVSHSSRITFNLFGSVEWMLSAVTCVTRGFDSCSMSGWYPAMTNRADADFLQVLCRQVGQDLFANLVFAECGLVLPDIEAPQTSMMAPTMGVAHIILWGREGVQGGVGFSGLRRKCHKLTPSIL